MLRYYRRLAAVGTLLALAVFLFSASAFAKGPLRTAAIRGCAGTYHGAPRLPDGHVDIPRLLDELTEIHANTYHWLIWLAPTDWEDLQTFLPLARARNINVWVTLVPPSESPPKSRYYSEPFRLDYLRWADEIGRLSARERNLVAWSIDDFGYNLDLFTPEYVRRMVKTARRYNRRLAFVPCCYLRDFKKDFAEKYRDVMDGCLFPYRAESSKANLTNATLVEVEIKKIQLQLGPKMPVILDVYASPHSKHGSSTPDYVREVMERGRRAADGVLIYCHQDPAKQPEKYRIIRELFRQWKDSAAPGASQ